MIKSWEHIENTYREGTKHNTSLDSMLSFVTQINQSSYARGLYGWTSMFDLCIVQTKVSHPYDGPELRIAPKFDGTIEFRYIDTPFKEKQWVRIVDENEAFKRLVGFIAQLHWFVVETKSSS